MYKFGIYSNIKYNSTNYDGLMKYIKFVHIIIRKRIRKDNNRGSATLKDIVIYKK